MRESELTEVWEETLRRMRACFDFGMPRGDASDENDARQTSTGEAGGRTAPTRTPPRAAAEATAGR